MVLYGRTRLQIETTVGRILGAVFVGSWTGNTSTTVNTDTKWKGGADDANGKWLHATSGDESGEIVRVTDDDGSGQLTHDALSGTPSAGETYILWDEAFRPEVIHELMDEAVRSLAGRFYDTIVDTSLFADGRQARFDIPSTFAMISELAVRSYIKETSLHPCDRTFDEATDSDFTQANDDQDYKRHGASLKMTVAVAAAADDFVADSIGSLDLSGFTHLEGWVKSTVALAAGDYVVHLDNGTVAADGSDLESLSVPAASADAWTHFRIALANPESDTAVVSVGLEMNVDKGAHTVWFDDLRAVHNDTAEWVALARHQWSVDRPNTDIVLTPVGLAAAGYRLMRLTGGDEPALLTSDSSVTEVPERYLIAKTVSLAAAQASRASGDKWAALAGHWEHQANRAYRMLPRLVDVRLAA